VNKTWGQVIRFSTIEKGGRGNYRMTSDNLREKRGTKGKRREEKGGKKGLLDHI